MLQERTEGQEDWYFISIDKKIIFVSKKKKTSEIVKSELR